MCCLHDLETLRVGEVVRERKLERHVANTGAAAEANTNTIHYKYRCGCRGNCHQMAETTDTSRQTCKLGKCRDSNAEIQKGKSNSA